MIFLLIALVIVFYSLFNYKKAFLIYLIFKILLVTNISFVSIPGIPLLTAEVFLDLSFLIIYMIKFGIFKKNDFPFSIPFALLTITYVAATIFSIAGIWNTLSTLIKEILNGCLIIMLIWKFVKTKKDFYFLFKWFSILILLSCVYGIWEQFSQTNPIVEWEATLNRDADKVISWTYTNDARGWRTQSFFEHAIGAGMIWSTYIISFLLLKIKYNFKFKNELLCWLNIVLCFICVIFTKSRTPLLFLILGLLSILGFRKKKNFYLTLGILGLAIIGGLILFSGNSYFSSFYIGGSSLEMRLNQLEHALNLFSKSPIFGLGFKYTSVISNVDVIELLGVESVWFTVIPTYGIVGIFSYIFYFIYMSFYLPHKYHSFELSILSFAYWISISVSSVPGYKPYLLFLLMFFIMKNPIYDKPKCYESKNLFKSKCNLCIGGF